MEEQEIKQIVNKKVSLAKVASMQLGLLDFKQRNAILLSIADALEKNISEIQFHNDIDVETAKNSGMDKVLIERLTTSLIQKTRIQLKLQVTVLTIPLLTQIIMLL